MKNMKKKLIIAFLIIIALEIFVFNINSFRVLNSKNEKIYTKNDISITKVDKNTYAEIYNISDEIKTVHIQLEDDEVKNEINYQIFYTDDTSSNYRKIDKKTYVQKLEKSKYIPVFLSGKSDKMKIKFENADVSVDKIIINEKIPFKFNILRVLVLYFIFISIYGIKNFKFFKIPFSKENNKQKAVMILSIIIFSVILIFINHNSKAYFPYDFYEKDFIDSLSSGKISLDFEVNPILKNLKNPYDMGLREKNKLISGSDYIWDTAYFNGKTYVYFGILPALILLVPYHLIFGGYLSSAVAIIIFSILTVISLRYLIENIFTKFYKKAPFKIMVFSFWIVLFGSQILVLNGSPRFYELAIISGLFFAITGINFLLLSFKNENVNYKYIFLSSLFLSLSVACRPTMLLVSLIAMPFFIKLIIQNIKSKNNIVKSILLIGIPYIIIGGLLMIYNYVRFGNIMEFGSSYQLTVNDMGKVSNRLMVIFTGLVCNLFEIPHFIAQFPFLENQAEKFAFYGDYYCENMIGGIFMLAPICFFVFSLPKLLKNKKTKDDSKIILLLLITGIIICVLSAMMAGSIQRYVADYAWIFIISGIACFMELYYNIYENQETKKLLESILKIIVVYSILLNFFGGIVSEGNVFKNTSTKIFYQLKYLIDFWE